MDLLVATAQQWDIDVVVICEPNIRYCKNKWSLDKDQTVAIRVLGNQVHPTRTGRGNGYVWFESSQCLVIGAYFSPNRELEHLKTLLYDIGETTRRIRKPTILAGDLNSKSPLWGSRVENGRGALVAEWLVGSGMQVVNNGDSPTFQRGASSSVIDITLVSQNTVDRLTGWRVHTEIENLSDHHYITYSLEPSEKAKEDWACRNNNGPGRKSWKIDDEALDAVEAEMSLTCFEESEGDPGKCVQDIQKILDRTCVSRRAQSTRRPVLWECESISF
jgi:hypothetical protein